MNIRRIIQASIALLIIGIGWEVYYLTGTSTITLVAAQTYTRISVDKKVYQTSGSLTITVPPGKHVITSSANGYETTNEPFTTTWRSIDVYNAVLPRKSFGSIFQEVAPELYQTDTQFVQDKFFQNSSWVAGYLIPDSGNGEPAMAVLKRETGIWKLVVYTQDASELNNRNIPTEIINYLVKP